jgi:hypothetical protein
LKKKKSTVGDENSGVGDFEMSFGEDCPGGIGPSDTIALSAKIDPIE